MALGGFYLGASYLLFDVHHLCKSEHSQGGVDQCVH